MDFYSYDDLPLKVYLEIVKSGDYSRLIKSGEAADVQCYQAWEMILKRNAKELGSFEFDTYVNMALSYAQLLSEFNIVKAILVRLAIRFTVTGPKQYTVDDQDLELLRKKGYKLDLSSELNYSVSLNAALQRSNNLVTKITMKQNELLRFSAASESDREVMGFEEVMADLDFHLGFASSREITLAGYNRLLKRLKERARKSNG